MNHTDITRRNFLRTAASAGALIPAGPLAQQTAGETPPGTFAQFANGTLATADATLADFPWIPHKDFAGVFLKNIIAKEETGGLLTCHLVRINPNCEIGLHRHPASMELHEVIEGEGACTLENKKIPYRPGTLAIMPINTLHGIRAGSAGLRLFAKFIIPPS